MSLNQNSVTGLFPLVTILSHPGPFFSHMVSTSQRYKNPLGVIDTAWSKLIYVTCLLGNHVKLSLLITIIIIQA